MESGTSRRAVLAGVGGLIVVAVETSTSATRNGMRAIGRAVGWVADDVPAAPLERGRARTTTGILTGSMHADISSSLRSTGHMVMKDGTQAGQLEADDLVKQAQKAFCQAVDAQGLIADGLTEDKLHGYLINAGGPYLDLDIRSQQQMRWNINTAYTNVAKAYAEGGVRKAQAQLVVEGICIF